MPEFAGGSPGALPVGDTVKILCESGQDVSEVLNVIVEKETKRLAAYKIAPDPVAGCVVELYFSSCNQNP